MTALDRLISNCNSIITTLRTFSDSEAQDVTFTWINDDDTTTDVTYDNIVQFQQTIQNQLPNQIIDTTKLKNIDGLIKDNNDNLLVGKPIPIKRLGDVLIDGYENDWKEYDSHWSCNISKDAYGMVTMTGLVTGGDKNTTIGKLPDEYLPLFDRVLSIQLAASDKFERVEVHRVDGSHDRAIYCGDGGTRDDDTSWLSINLSWQARVES